jgi:hypothetical protein
LPKNCHDVSEKKAPLLFVHSAVLIDTQSRHEPWRDFLLFYAVKHIAQPENSPYLCSVQSHESGLMLSENEGYFFARTVKKFIGIRTPVC